MFVNPGIFLFTVKQYNVDNNFTETSTTAVRRRRPAAATRNMSLSLAEELLAAVTAESSSPSRQSLPSSVVADELIRCAGGGIAQFLVDVAELGSPDQVDPVNKFRDVVCDLAYGCVVVERHVDDDDACTKSCCDVGRTTMVESTSSTSGHVVADDCSDSSTLLSTSRDGSDVTAVTSSSGAASVGGASDTGYVASDDSVTAARDEVEGKKFLLNHFDRTTSLDSSRKFQRAHCLQLNPLTPTVATWVVQL